ncbi:MAG: hypothetical protein SNH63_04170 [Rikenellaceae bacterium]
MKKQDLIFAAVIALFVLPFVTSATPYEIYKELNVAHPYCLAYAKFAILATLGEMLVLRIRTGVYKPENFGMITRAVVWGFYGVWIAIAMKTFAMGAPAMVESLGVEGVVEAMRGGFSPEKLLGAFAISVMMNTAYGPVFMTLHKITDIHIVEHKGSISSLWSPIGMRRIFRTFDWETQWNFVIKRTIPLFWIPAHTITFMLPATSQVLFAALLSIALGILLSVQVAINNKR